MQVRPHRVRPTSTHLAIEFISPLLRKNNNIVRTMKQNHTKQVYFSFFNPWNVTDEPEIESLGHGGELDMGRNRYKHIN